MYPATGIMRRPRIVMVCDKCGSKDVFADAWASWDAQSQKWVLEQSFDAGYCNYCQAECTVWEKAGR